NVLSADLVSARGRPADWRGPAPFFACLLLSLAIRLAGWPAGPTPEQFSGPCRPATEREVPVGAILPAGKITASSSRSEERRTARGRIVRRAAQRKSRPREPSWLPGRHSVAARPQPRAADIQGWASPPAESSPAAGVGRVGLRDSVTLRRIW